MAAAKGSGDGWKRVVAVFQPNRYNRIAVQWPEYADAFVDADLVVLTDIYASGTTPIPGVTGKLIVNAVLDAHPHARVVWLPRRSDLVEFVAHELRDGDVCISMGCGDIAQEPCGDGPVHKSAQGPGVDQTFLGASHLEDISGVDGRIGSLQHAIIGRAQKGVDADQGAGAHPSHNRELGSPPARPAGEDPGAKSAVLAPCGERKPWAGAIPQRAAEVGCGIGEETRIGKGRNIGRSLILGAESLALRGLRLFRRLSPGGGPQRTGAHCKPHRSVSHHRPTEQAHPKSLSRESPQISLGDGIWFR
jgi:hypothetical protein